MTPSSHLRWPVAATESAEPRRRVLMLAYYFPPSDSIGARRPDGLARHLPAFGWDPVVLAPERPGSAPEIVQTPDHSWMRTVEAARKSGYQQAWLRPEMRKGKGLLGPLVKGAKNLLRLLPAWYDEYTGWSFPAIDRGIAEGRKRGVDLVWATCNPFSSALAARKIADALGVPCVVDLRDPLNDYLAFPRNTTHWFYRAMRRVDAVTVVGEYCITPLLQQVRGERPCYGIFSGSWQADVIPAQPAPTFTLLHAGWLYNGQRSPRPLFEAMALLADELPDFRRCARARFVGSDSAVVRDIPGYDRVADMVDIVSAVSYAEVAAMMREAAVLLIINGEGMELADPMPGKFYDYLPYEAPILSLGGVGGTLATLLDWTRAGAWAGSPRAIADVIRPWFLAWQRDGVARAERRPEARAYFHQRRVAAESAEVFNALIAHRPVNAREHPPWEA